MDETAPFVWSAYAVAAVVWIALVARAILTERHWRQRTREFGDD
jgi:heme exporter protein D